MIRYDLKCQSNHRFDAWFRNSAAFDDQVVAGEIACPECGSGKIEKAPMAPSIARASSKSQREETPPVSDGNDEMTSLAETKQTAVAGKLREALFEMRRHVEANADNVGDKFAEEARKIHKGESEDRNIYGETSESEAQALEEEGVPFSRIPWPKHDS